MVGCARMRISFFVIIILLLPLTVRAAESHRDRLISNCVELDECLEILDRTLPDEDQGVSIGDEDEIARVLKERFGRKAKDSLLDKALGDHGGWRNFAGAVLMYWRDWSEEDVPKLGKALRLQSGGWIAHPLADIGSPAAIKALTVDLPFAGRESQTGAALIRIGPKVVPYLLCVLELPEPFELNGSRFDGPRAAMDLISEFGEGAAFVAPEWARIARSKSKPRSRRLGALRGLAAIGEHGQGQWVALRPLLAEGDKDIAKQTYDTLVAMHDPTVALKFATECPFGLGPFENQREIFALVCLRSVSEFGKYGQPAGPLLVERLRLAKNGAEQTYLIEALGLISYQPAAEKIREFLYADDWRVTWASVRSLGWLKAKAALADIERVEQTHWLPELRNLARLVRISLETNTLFKEPAHYWESWSGRGRLFGTYSGQLLEPEKCTSAEWAWEQESVAFKTDKFRIKHHELELSDGKLVGENHGEWGGALKWVPHEGEPTVLIEDNVIALLSTRQGPVAVFGLAHLFLSRGYAVGLTRNPAGTWNLHEMARFTAATYALRPIGGDRFAAAATDGRVFIFSSDGIEGLASCTEH